nr:PREDICTED: trefoil factor 1 [Struthio camelus australis]
MESKVFWLLTISMIVGLSSTSENSSECNVHPKARENCGFPGITETECLEQKCCFDSVIPDVPWCFGPLSPDCCS